MPACVASAVIAAAPARAARVHAPVLLTKTLIIMPITSEAGRTRAS
jgi:hypothetical protein